MDDTFPTPKQYSLPFGESLHNAQGVPPQDGFMLGMNQHFVWGEYRPALSYSLFSSYFASSWKKLQSPD